MVPGWKKPGILTGDRNKDHGPRKQDPNPKINLALWRRLPSHHHGVVLGGFLYWFKMIPFEMTQLESSWG